MTLLVTGPSNVGKSTYIAQAGWSPVVHAYELSGREVPIDGAIHYNLLYHAQELHQAGTLAAEWDLLAEPIFAKIISSGAVARATVIVAPVEQLLARASRRHLNDAENTALGQYSSDLWCKIIAKVSLCAMYERLFEICERAEIPVDVLYSCTEFAAFLPSARAHIHRDLRGRFTFQAPHAAL